MRKNIFGTLSLALLLAGCSQESDFDNLGQSGGETFTFVASSAVDANTRTTMDVGGLITWDTKDRIMVNGKQSGAPTLSADKSTAEFTVKDVTGQTFDAFYPANMIKTSGDGYSGGKYTFTLPTTQVYKDNVTFGPDMNPSIGTISYASGESKYKVGFYNLCGLFRVNIKADHDIPNVSYVQLALPGGSPLKSGRYVADPKAHTLTAVSGSEQRDVFVHFTSPKTITKNGLTLFFVLPPGTYPGGWQLKLLDKNKRPVSTYKTGSSPITIRRSKISSLTVEGFEKVLFISNDNYCYGAFNAQSTSVVDLTKLKTVLSNPVYWDNNGPLYMTADGKTYTKGIWIKNTGYGPGRALSATLNRGINDAIRNDPTMTFLPASGYSGGYLFTGISSIGKKGYYWTNGNMEFEGGINYGEPCSLYFNEDENTVRVRGDNPGELLLRVNWSLTRTGY